jgi:putative Holliday junction resolvase
MLQKQQRTRIIGIDFGLARIGLSMSDESKIIAMSLETMKAEKKSEFTVSKLVNLLVEHQKSYGYTIESIIIGLPLMMSGKQGLLADEVQHFVALLSKAIDVPVITWDERLTSVQADRSLRECNFSRKKRAQKSDAVAAVIILQNYLDFRIRDIERKELEIGLE